jgi:hypothetical protein
MVTSTATHSEPLDSAAETDLMVRTHRCGGKSALANLRGKQALAKQQLADVVAIEYWRHGGYPQFIQAIRDKVHEEAEASSRVAYLEKLDAGIDPGPFIPPTPNDADEARHVLRMFIAARFPTSLEEVLANVNGVRAEIKTKLAGLQDESGEVHHDASEWHLAKGNIDPIEFARQVRYNVRTHADVSTRFTAIDTALASFPARLAGKVKAVVDSIGAAVIAGAIAESTILAGSNWGADTSKAEVDAATSRINTIDGKLAALGIDPNNRPSTVGLIGGDLLKTRDDATAAMVSAKKAAAKRLNGRCTEMVASASAGSVSAWEFIGKQALTMPAAFPPGFIDAWKGAAVDALADAGGVAIVNALGGPQK